MKSRIVVIVSIMMVCALAVGMVLQHHHHDANGAVCICMSAECHADYGHHHDGCAHDHSSESESGECSLHFDEFCSNKNDAPSKADLSYVSLLFISNQILDIIPQLIEARIYMPQDNDALRIFFWLNFSGLRAPPADNIFLV